MASNQLRNDGRSGDRHAEQLADDRDGQRQGEAGEEVHRLFGGAGGEIVDGVEELVGDGLDPGPHPRHPTRGEGGTDEPPQAAVVGSVGEQQVMAEDRMLTSLGHEARPCPQRGADVLGQAGVEQRLASLLVTGHDPGRTSVGQHHGPDGPVGPDPGVEAVRVVAGGLVESGPAGDGASGKFG